MNFGKKCNLSKSVSVNNPKRKMYQEKTSTEIATSKKNHSVYRLNTSIKYMKEK